MINFKNTLNVVDTPTDDFNVIASNIEIENPYQEIILGVIIVIAVLLIFIIGLRLIVKAIKKNKN